MEIHDRLMNVPTTGVKILEILTDHQERKSLIIRELLEVCSEKISNNCSDLQVLEVFRMILCYEYQTFINSGIRWSSFKANESKIDLKTFFVRHIESFADSKEFVLLYDIATLRLAFSCNKKALVSLFKDFYESEKEHLATEHETLHLCLRVFECIADSYNLHSCLNKENEEKEEFEELLDCIPSVIELWMKQDLHIQWQMLTTLLPKLVLIFGAPNVLTPLWNILLDDQNELGKMLDMLCVMADTYFPTEENHIGQIHYEYSISTEFWLVLLRSLDSDIYQERKKAVYLIRRVLDFIESNESVVRTHLDISKAQMVPFICTDALTKKIVVDSVKNSFFSILESSEQKQKSLVLPVLKYLPDLVEAYSTQKSQGYYFHKKWLQCVFKRVLRHDNIAIKLVGSRETLKADLNIYDESLFDFLANCLNNILLYDCEVAYDFHYERKCPEIVMYLVEFFVRSDEAQMPLINTFVRAISTIAWCPVAIYWMLEALVIAAKNKKIVHNMWTREELGCMKNLIDLNLPKLGKILRKGSNELILTALCQYIPSDSYWPEMELITSTINFVAEPNDPQILSNVHDRMQIIIKASDAQLYISRQCETLWPKQSTESFAKTIILLYSSTLILREENCCAKQSLDKLFEILNDEHCSSFSDKTAMLRVLELASYLMIAVKDLDSNCTVGVHQLLSSHIPVLTRIAESCIKETSIPEREHTIAIGALIEYNACQKTDSLRTFCDQCIDFVANPNKLTKYHWLYTLKAINVYNQSYLVRPTKLPLTTTMMRAILKHFKDEILDDPRHDVTKGIGDFGRTIVSNCSQNVATLVWTYINHNFSWLDAAVSENGFWFENFQLFIERGPEENIIVITNSITRMLCYEKLNNENIGIVISIIRLCWQLIVRLNETQVFFDATKSLTELMISERFLTLDQAKEIALEWVDYLMQEGKTVPFLMNIFIIQIQNLGMNNVLLFRQPFICCLLHGETPRHEEKLKQAAISYCNYGKWWENIDKRIRAQAVIFLELFAQECDYASYSDEFRRSRSEFRESMLQGILMVLKEHRHEKYLENSPIHRLKQRAMQAMLLLTSFPNEIEKVRKLYDEMCDLLITESNQRSVRQMQEWLLVRIYAKSLKDGSVWKLFQTAIEKRPESIVSVASVVYHISQLLDGGMKISFISKAISHLLPNCMSQHLNVRLYSQVILVKLYEMLPEARRDRYEIIIEGVQESFRHGNSIKNAQKIMQDFYFTKFNSNQDYNFQTLFYDLPRLTGVSSDELMELHIFHRLVRNKFEHIIELNCSGQFLDIKSPKPPSRSAEMDQEIERSQ